MQMELHLSVSVWPLCAFYFLFGLSAGDEEDEEDDDDDDVWKHHRHHDDDDDGQDWWRRVIGKEKGKHER